MIGRYYRDWENEQKNQKAKALGQAETARAPTCDYADSRAGSGTDLRGMPYRYADPYAVRLVGGRPRSFGECAWHSRDGFLSAGNAYAPSVCHVAGEIP